ncbi:unnamed protein product [Soboliphyme baturini]|uniref:AB hydrolase-1 domain-containing protein n=1 Tax=Soboliphyme baturini TaxID=241478 RepID=A0A183IBL9_9BILA|nr:unnamed protein product [Soboliphyme baturini]
MFKLNDGGQLALDWSIPENCLDICPVVIILPGLTGTTHDRYVQSLAKTINDLRYKAVVFNYRGGNGAALLTPKIYCACDTDDIQAVVWYIKKKWPRCQCMAVGISVGGGLLFNYLSRNDAERTGLKAAMIISTPWDPVASSKSLEQYAYRFIFNRRLTKNLCHIVQQNKEILQSMVDVDAALKASLIREFDELVTAPLSGFKTANDYYRAAAIYHKVNMVSVPTVCLNAEDDCFSPIEGM